MPPGEHGHQVGTVAARIDLPFTAGWLSSRAGWGLGSMLNQAKTGSMALQVGANFMQFLRSLLGLESRIGPADAAIIMAGAGSPFLINESTKKGSRKASDLLSEAAA